MTLVLLQKKIPIVARIERQEETTKNTDLPIMKVQHEYNLQNVSPYEIINNALSTLLHPKQNN